MKKAVEALVQQAAWFAAVLGAARGYPWAGPVAVAAVLGLRIAWSGHRRAELAFATCAAAAGFALDSALTAAGLYAPRPHLLPPPWSAPWMVSLWVSFAATLNGPLRSLRGRYGLAALLGAVGGPAAYAAGERLGAVTFGEPPALGLVVLAGAWAAAVAGLLRLAEALEGRAGKERRAGRPYRGGDLPPKARRISSIRWRFLPRSQ